MYKSLNGEGYGLDVETFASKYGRVPLYELRGDAFCRKCRETIDVTRIENGVTILKATRVAQEPYEKRFAEVVRHDGQIMCPLCGAPVAIGYNMDADKFRGARCEKCHKEKTGADEHPCYCNECLATLMNEMDDMDGYK